MIKIGNEWIEESEEFKNEKRYLCVQEDKLEEITNYMDEGKIEYEKASIYEFAAKERTKTLFITIDNTDKVSKEQRDFYYKELYKTMRDEVKLTTPLLLEFCPQDENDINGIDYINEDFR